MSKKDNRMSVKESADFIGVHTNTIYEWIKEGKLRADREGKSYKINHMDVLGIYTSKTRVDKDKDTLVSIQNVREESKEIIEGKALKIFCTMQDCVDKRVELSEKYQQKLKEFDENEPDIIKRGEYHFDLQERVREKNIKILLRAREEIESFYYMYDFIENLNEMYRYKESNRNTLEEELKLQKAIDESDFEYLFKNIPSKDINFSNKKR